MLGKKHRQASPLPEGGGEGSIALYETDYSTENGYGYSKQADSKTSPPSGRGVENIPQGIFKGGACESKRFLRVLRLDFLHYDMTRTNRFSPRSPPCA